MWEVCAEGCLQCRSRILVQENSSGIGWQKGGPLVTEMHQPGEFGFEADSGIRCLRLDESDVNESRRRKQRGGPFEAFDEKNQQVLPASTVRLVPVTRAAFSERR